MVTVSVFFSSCESLNLQYNSHLVIDATLWCIEYAGTYKNISIQQLWFVWRWLRLLLRSGGGEQAEGQSETQGWRRSKQWFILFCSVNNIFLYFLNKWQKNKKSKTNDGHVCRCSLEHCRWSSFWLEVLRILEDIKASAHRGGVEMAFKSLQRSNGSAEKLFQLEMRPSCFLVIWGIFHFKWVCPGYIMLGLPSLECSLHKVLDCIKTA